MAENGDSKTATSDQLRQYIERVERLEEEKRALMADIRDVYSEAKGNGFEPKIMRRIVKMRAMDKDLLRGGFSDFLLSSGCRAGRMSEVFADRLAAALEKSGTPLCMGIDPHPALLPAFLSDQEPVEAIRLFGQLSLGRRRPGLACLR